MLIALIASLVLFVLDAKLGYFQPVRNVLSTVVYPIQVVASVPEDTRSWLGEYFQTRESLQEKNAELESNYLLNQVRLQKLQALERENMRLRELLGSSFRLSERVFVAELLTIDLDPFSQQVIIDKGKRSGVFIGQPVLDAYGVMGQVTEVNTFSSRVVLLTDPSHAIPVQINRNGLRAVVVGDGLTRKLRVQHLPRNADIRVGDLLETSGLGGRFPDGYPVGEIEEVNFPVGKAFAEVIVTPAANLDASREVLLVMPSSTTENRSEN
jgi:rod shape-determining protein MreC